MRCYRSGVSVLPALCVAVALGACGSTGATTPTAAPTSPAVLGPTPLPVSINAAPPASTPSAAVATPVSAPVGVVPCPVLTPTGQHTLGSPGGPGSGQHQAGLDFCGGGSATIPTGTTRFTTAAGWGLGIADSCLVGTSGQAGMNTVLTVTETIPGGGKGPDSATEAGDWVDSGTVLMATGGNFQLQVTSISPSCVWHITIYPT